LEVVGEPLRCQAAGVHRREWVSHLHDTLEGEGSKRREGIEHNAHRIHHPGRVMGASMTIEGATDAQAFEAYMERFLAPTLKEGQVVVLDGLGAHRTEKVRELIEERGADLLFLPSYSPDLNPIEESL
jgi:hypothetical protein